MNLFYIFYFYLSQSLHRFIPIIRFFPPSTLNAQCGISFRCTIKRFNNSIHFPVLIKVSVDLFPMIVNVFNDDFPNTMR